MKKSTGLLFSTALLGIGLTLAAPAVVQAADIVPIAAITKATVTNKQSEVYRTADTTKIAAFDDAELTKSNGKTVQGFNVNGYAWVFQYAYDQIATDPAGTITAYHFADGWASAKDFSVKDPTVYQVEQWSGVGQVDAKSPAVVYSDPGLTKPTGKTLPVNSRWQYFSRYNAMVTINGQTGVAGTLSYNLGGNQWVGANFSVDTDAADFTVNPVRGTIIVTNSKGVKLYSDMAQSNPTGRTLPVGSRWQAYATINDKTGTITGFSLGGNQYVNNADTSMILFASGTFTVRYPAAPSWGIAVYNGQLKVTKTIPAGSRWRTFGQIERLVNGRTQSFYNIGGDQWVRTDYGTHTVK